MDALHINLTPTLGCVYIGGAFSLMLYGFSCGQFMYYLYHYLKSDKPLVKSMVIFVWLLDTIIIGADMQIGWFYFVQSHANLFSLRVFPRSYELDYTATAVIIWVVQMFYIREIWQLTAGLRFGSKQSGLLTACIPTVLSAVAFAFTLVGVYNSSTQDWLLSRSVPANTAWALSNSFVAAAADVYISGALCLVLRRQKTGFRSSDKKISKLVTYIINRGFFSAMVQIVLASTYLITREMMLFMIFHLTGTKVYINSMMAVLNARKHITDAGGINMSDWSE